MATGIRDNGNLLGRSGVDANSINVLSNISELDNIHNLSCDMVTLSGSPPFFYILFFYFFYIFFVF